PPEGGRAPVRRRAARYRVPAHDADRGGRAVRLDPGPGQVGQPVVDPVVVQPLDQRVPYARHGSAAGPEVVVHDRVEHCGEAALGEAGRQVLRRVQPRRVGRERYPRESRYHQRAAADQGGRVVGGGEPASEEEGVRDVHSGQRGRHVDVEGYPLDRETGQGPGREVQVELGPRLDLVGAVVVRGDHVDRWRRRHRTILPGLWTDHG